MGSNQVNDSSSRERLNTTIDRALYRKIKVLAAKQDRHANEILEEGMELVLEKYEE